MLAEQWSYLRDLPRLPVSVGYEGSRGAGGAVKLLAHEACGSAFCAAVWVFV